MKKACYALLALGGTFDHLHAGHEKFLRFAGEKSEQLLIGLTSQQLASRKDWPQSVQSYAKRAKTLTSYCKKQGYQFEIIKISDVYGTTLKDKQIDGLAVTSETLAGGRLINRARAKLGLPELPIEICSLLTDQLGQAIHSERIRSGEINRRGFVYEQLFKQDLVLNEQQKKALRNLQFNIISKPLQNQQQLPVCVVGDQALKRFRKEKWQYSLAIYDGLIQRKEIECHQFIRPNFCVFNPAGQISVSLTEVIKKVWRKSDQYIFVRGEEDLAALALIMLLPLGSLVYFGLPNQGLACVKVDETIKQQFLGIVCV